MILNHTSNRLSTARSFQYFFIILQQQPQTKNALTSFNLCCSLLHKNVPNRQLYKWSRMVTRKYSLNSKAAGNLNKNSFISVLENHVIVKIFFHTSLPLIAYLASQLPDTVNELNKNRWPVCICVVLVAMADTLQEMKERQSWLWCNWRGQRTSCGFRTVESI